MASFQSHAVFSPIYSYFGNPKFFGSTVRIAEEMAPNSEIAALGEASAPLGCLTAAVTLACVRDLYKTSDYTPKVPNKNYVGITNYLNQTVSGNTEAKRIELTFHSHLTSTSAHISP